MKQVACRGAMVGMVASLSVITLSWATAHSQSPTTTPTSAPASAPADTAPKADIKPALPDDWVKAFTWRSIGPANMGGRITALAVNEADPSMFWVASASGGLLKTVNNGFSFEHLFDRESTVSIGDLAVAPSDPNILWIGTGEANPRNSSSWGDGVYKSIDGGKTWTNMGLKGIFQTGQIAIHPTDSNIVFIGGLGRLWGVNEERGLFKTIDGGKTWEKVLYVDDKTGVIDVQMQPGNPDVMLAATYERQRDGFDGNDPAKKFGPGSAMWKSTDGGKTWKKLTQGLPTSNLGRVGLNWYRKDPNIVYAIVESEKIGQEPENAPFAGLAGEDAQVGARLTAITEGGPAARAELKVGDIVIRINESAIHSYESLLAEIRRHLAGDTVHVEVSRDRKTVKVDLTFDKRPEEQEDQPAAPPAQEGGPQSEAAGENQPAATQPGATTRPARTPFSSGLGGQRENIHEQQGPNGADYGGVYMSADAGETWTRINSVNPRPMYFSEIRVDPSDNKFLYVLGISLYKSEDGGKEFKGGAEGEAHVDHHALWIDPKDGRHMILGNDGGIYVTYDRMAKWDHLNTNALGQFYHVGVDSRENYRVYGGLQDNGTWGGPNRVRDGAGPINEDWVSIGGGDGFICFVDENDPDQVYYASQNGGLATRNLRTGESSAIRPAGRRGVRYRWNWETPYVLSSHNSRIYYTAANYVFKSLDRGRDLKAISPEITNTDKGSATAVAESPRDPDVLYVGTDDGAMWMTRNGGKDWLNLFDTTAVNAAAQAATRPERGGRGQGGGPGAGGREGGGDGRRRGGGSGGAGGQAGPGGGFSPEMLKRMDSNGNGSIEKGEMPERMAAMFDRLDVNKDGSIDPKEMEAAGEAMRQRGEGGAGGADSPPTTQPETEDANQPASQPASQPEASPASTQPATQPATTAPATTAPAADPITGAWEGRIIRDDLPEEFSKFTFSLKMTPDGRLSGIINTRFSDGDLSGNFNAKSKKLRMRYGDDQRTVEYTAELSPDGRLIGESSSGEGRPVSKFEAMRTSTDPNAGDQPAEEKADGQPIAELMPGPRWVSSLETSRAAAGRVYVTFDGHRSDDLEPYVFVSEDYGRHWKSIRANLPTSAGSIKCVREDRINPNLLYLGTEFGAWVSIDRGTSWTKFHNNLPTVAVHDFAIHPTAGEIVAATHGRSLWVMDVTALRQMSADSAAQRAVLFTPNDAVYWRSTPERAGTLRRFVGENPSRNLMIHFLLNKPAQRLQLKVTTLDGQLLREFEVKNEAGVQRVEWDLRRPAPAGPPRGGRGAGGGGGGGRRGGLMPAGTYRVSLTVDDLILNQDVTVRTDPEFADYRPWETEEAELEFERTFVIEEPEKGNDNGAEDDQH